MSQPKSQSKELIDDLAQKGLLPTTDAQKAVLAAVLASFDKTDAGWRFETPPSVTDYARDATVFLDRHFLRRW